MAQLINVPGVGTVSFPDNMSDAEISSAIQKNLPSSNESQADNSQTNAPLQSEEFKKSYDLGANSKEPKSFTQSLAETFPLTAPFTDTGKRALIGAGSGLTRAGQGIKQIGLNVAESLGLAPKGTTNNYTKQVEQERAAYNQSPVAQSVEGQTGQLIGENIPYAAGGGAGLLGRTLIGTGIGASQFVPENGSRTFNALLGAGVNAAAPPVLASLLSKNPYVKAGTGATLGAALGYGETDSPYKGAAAAVAGAGAPFIPSLARNTLGNVAGRIAGKITGASPEVINPIEKTLQPAAALNTLNGVDEQKALDALAAARRLDPNFTLTPAEASGSPIAAGAQGKLGTSKEGAQILYNAGQKSAQSQQNIIQNFLSELSPNPENASVNLRQAAKNALTQKEQELSNKASPLYEAAKKSSAKVDVQPVVDYLDNELKTAKGEIATNLNKALTYLKPAGQPNAENFDTSIEGLHNAKLAIDDLIEGRGDNSIGKTTEKKLVEVKKLLVKQLEKASDTYKSARTIFSEDAPAIKALKESPVGKIADLPDLQLKNIPNIIFDPRQTDPRVLAQIRDQIVKQNPDAWRTILRNHIENQLDKAGDYPGSTIYSKLLKSDRSFNQLITATEGLPDTQKKLVDMRSAFKNLINTVTPQTAARLSKSSLDVPRSTAEAVITHAKNLLGGQYDVAATKLITSNQWDKEFKTIANIKDKNERALRFSALLGRISATTGINAINQTSSPQN
jgi:hypothetical protein